MLEYAITKVAVIEKDKDSTEFETKKKGCPNCQLETLFHGTDVNAVSSIVVDGFLTGRRFEYGIGTYLSDSLDCAQICNPGFNKRTAPSVGGTFNFVAVLVYYDGSKCVHITDDRYTLREDLSEMGDEEIKKRYPDKVVKENGIHTIDIDENMRMIPDISTYDQSKPHITYYIVFEKSQMLLMFAITAQRNEYCVIWRDPNLDIENGFTSYNKRLKLLIEEKTRCNVYFASTTDEALKLVERKKKNKIILISNIGKHHRGKKFVEEARKIIGSNVIVLFSSFDQKHLEWLKEFPNALFSNEVSFYERYISDFTVDGLNSLKSDIEEHYKTKFPDFTPDFLSFPHYEDGSKSSAKKDLNFTYYEFD